MKTSYLAALAGLAFLLAACIPSVKPFYQEKDVVFDPRLLGDWRGGESAKDTQIWRFKDRGRQSYDLTIIESEAKEGRFVARLFQLKQGLFLDLTPSDVEFATHQADLVAWAVFPGHLLVRVVALEPSLRLAFFDYDWLEKHLKANPKALAHHREDDRFLLTASTPELQRFVLKHLADEGLFQKPGEMVRLTNAPAAGKP